MRTSQEMHDAAVDGLGYDQQLDEWADDIEQLEIDYDLSMEVLRSIVDLTFPDLEVREPYMATLKRKADDAVKRWQKRLKMWRLRDEGN